MNHSLIGVAVPLAAAPDARAHRRLAAGGLDKCMDGQKKKGGAWPPSGGAISAIAAYPAVLTAAGLAALKGFLDVRDAEFS